MRPGEAGGARGRAGAGAGRQGKPCRALSAGHLRRGEPGHLLLRRLRLDVGECRAPSSPPAGAPGLGLVRGPQAPGVVAIAADSSFFVAGRVRLQLGGLRHQLPVHELHGKAVFHRRWQPCRRGN